MVWYGIIGDNLVLIWGFHAVKNDWWWLIYGWYIRVSAERVLVNVLSPVLRCSTPLHCSNPALRCSALLLATCTILPCESRASHVRMTPLMESWAHIKANAIASTMLHGHGAASSALPGAATLPGWALLAPHLLLLDSPNWRQQASPPPNLQEGQLPAFGKQRMGQSELSPCWARALRNCKISAIVFNRSLQASEPRSNGAPERNCSCRKADIAAPKWACYLDEYESKEIYMWTCKDIASKRSTGAATFTIIIDPGNVLDAALKLRSLRWHWGSGALRIIDWNGKQWCDSHSANIMATWKQSSCFLNLMDKFIILQLRVMTHVDCIQSRTQIVGSHRISQRFNLFQSYQERLT